MFKEKIMHNVRNLKIIEDGIIDKVYDKVKAADNPAEVLEYLQGN